MRWPSEVGVNHRRWRSRNWCWPRNFTWADGRLALFRCCRHRRRTCRCRSTRAPTRRCQPACRVVPEPRRSRVDMAQFALVGFQCPVPEFSPTQVTPVTKRFDLMVRSTRRFRDRLGGSCGCDTARPRASLPPRRPGSRRRQGSERGEHAAGRRIDLLDAISGDLEQVLAVESGARMRGNIELAHSLAALGIDRIQRVAGGDPDIRAVKTDTMHVGRRPEREYSRRISLLFVSYVISALAMRST